MDIVNDLTSQAVSFLTVVQDMIKQEMVYSKETDTSAFFYGKTDKIHELEHQCGGYQRERISEVIWMSKDEVLKAGSVSCFFKCAAALLSWLQKCEKELKGKDGHQLGTLYSSPYEWRESIRFILYELPGERIELVKILHYMPLQVILCLGGGKKEVYQQCLYQAWSPRKALCYEGDDEITCILNLISPKDEKDLEEWWTGDHKGQGRLKRALLLLQDHELLLKTLLEESVPVPFDTMLSDELDEIANSRKIRVKEHLTETEKQFREDIFGKKKHKEKAEKSYSLNDPLGRAKDMELYGLAFSGGGIRSATFNLGILQKLAERGLLKKFDYLSTVSGGGYIGTWVESWISRTGSIMKVNDRLNPEKSADPLADEVRPIRWLRMFSNYLSPNASIMSADAWTIGITWLRNTVINQVMLLLLFCAALSGLRFVYGCWYMFGRYIPINDWKIIAFSAIVFFGAAILAGSGMHAYNPEYKPRSIFKAGKSEQLATWLIRLGRISAFVVSACLFAEGVSCYGIYTKALSLWLACVIAFFALLLVAWLGRYDKCAAETDSKVKIYFLIILSSGVASVAGLALLACCWQLLSSIKGIVGMSHKFPQELAFVVGLPLILEAVSITVVVRMAIMGNSFPDERREWWGRVGAIVHRSMLLWVLITGSVLLLPDLYNQYIIKDPHAVSWKWISTSLGGWSVIVGTAVKMAFGSKTSGDKNAKASSGYAELFVTAAPYIFFVGILIISSYLLHFITHRIGGIQTFKGHQVCVSLLVAAGLGLIAYLLSLRVGVNEFSLHHFYRNRLVRAYLGATRPRTEREKTANSFTDFDRLDDMKLADLLVQPKDRPEGDIEKKANGYTGPYPIINTALNATVVTEFDRQDRKAESFIFTPKYCGFDFSRTRASARSAKKSYDYGYRPTDKYGYPDGPELGTAMAISGAAVNPNWGYHSSPATAFLLTIFNVRLGWWMGNPRKSTWTQSDPTYGLAYLLSDLIGKTDSSSDFVCLSDGGHFDNLGIYELVRRRCKYILVCDAGQDVKSTCEDLANAVRRTRIDFGAQVELDIKELLKITEKDAKGFADEHSASGTIWYPGDPEGKPSGVIRYVKTSVSPDQSVDLREYFMDNEEFPQQSTADQFFDEAQFESYRKLGYSSLK